MREESSKRIKNVIELLTNAGVCHQVFHSHCTGTPLYAAINPNAYKLLFMDIGIANNICGNDWIFLESTDDRNLVNEGGLAEQFIGQHLMNPYEAPRLTYWLREARSANAEVDYVISQGNLIIPVEVKAGKSGSLKSLQQFVFYKKTETAVRFDLDPPSVQNVKHIIRTRDGNRPVDYIAIISICFPLQIFRLSLMGLSA